jgi:hypothetical protein
MEESTSWRTGNGSRLDKTEKALNGNFFRKMDKVKSHF